VSLTPKRRPFEPNLQNPLTATTADVSETTDYIFPKLFSSTETCNSRFAVTAQNHIRTKVEQIKNKEGKKERKKKKRNVKVKLSLVHGVKAYRGSRGIAPFIPNIRNRRSCPAPLPGRLTPLPIEQDAGRAPELVWTVSKNLLPIPELKPRTVESLYRLPAIPALNTAYPQVKSFPRPRHECTYRQWRYISNNSLPQQ